MYLVKKPNPNLEDPLRYLYIKIKRDDGTCTYTTRREFAMQFSQEEASQTIATLTQNTTLPFEIEIL